MCKKTKWILLAIKLTSIIDSDINPIGIIEAD